MIGELLQQFTGSKEGDEALQTLKNEHGLDGDQAKSALETAASGAANALGSEQGGLDAVGKMLGGGGGSAVLGALGGLAGGSGGLTSALQGGLSGVAADKIAEMIAPVIGVDQGKAKAIAATVIPYIMKFLQSRSSGGEQAGGGGGEEGGGGLDIGGALKKLF